MKERKNRSAKEWQNYAPEYLGIMGEWLKKLPMNKNVLNTDSHYY